MWNNAMERRGTRLDTNRFRRVDGIEIDMKTAVAQFLDEMGGNEMDLIPHSVKKFIKRKKTWMKHQGIISEQGMTLYMIDPHWLTAGPVSYMDCRTCYMCLFCVFVSDEREKSDLELVYDREWTHKLGVYNHLTNTDYSTAHETLRMSVVEIEDYYHGLALPRSYSAQWNSRNITESVDYLRSTSELGKIVIYQLRYKPKKNELVFKIDVFPGFDAKVMGPNPYVMFREAFGVKHLASLVPYDHKVSIPQCTVPIDYQQIKMMEAQSGQTQKEDNSQANESVAQL